MTAIRLFGLAGIVYGIGGMLLAGLPTWTLWVVFAVEVVFMWFVGFPWMARLVGEVTTKPGRPDV